jgi:hypothetical protein
MDEQGVLDHVGVDGELESPAGAVEVVDVNAAGLSVAEVLVPPSLKEILLALSVRRTTLVPAPIAVKVLIADRPVLLRSTSVAVLRPQWIQSVLPWVVRSTLAGGAATLPVRSAALTRLASKSANTIDSIPVRIDLISRLLFEKSECTKVS